MEYRYDIRQFSWNKELNTFFAEAYHLECFRPDGTIHPECFPNMKEQFFIDNPKTGGFRRFRYIESVTEHYTDTYEDGSLSEFEVHSWIFESEDGIKCNIFIS